MTDGNPDDGNDLVTMFHGTSMRNFDSILTIGLQPRIGAVFVAFDFGTAAGYAVRTVLVGAAAAGDDDYGEALVLSLRVDSARLRHAGNAYVAAADGSTTRRGGDECAIRGTIPPADLVERVAFDPTPALAAMSERAKRELVENAEQVRAVEAQAAPLRFFNPGGAASVFDVLRGGVRVTAAWR